MPPTSTLFPYTTLFRSFLRKGAASAAETVSHSHRSRTPLDECTVGQGCLHGPAGAGRAARRDFAGLQFGPHNRPYTREKRLLRSEEHTSELQSQSNLVCRLLLHSFPTRRSSDLFFGREPLVPPRQSATLTEAELRLMNVLWDKGACTVQQVLDGLPGETSLAYNSVLTTVRILEKKGYLDRKSTRLNSSHSQISYAAYFYTLSLHDALPIFSSEGSR